MMASDSSTLGASGRSAAEPIEGARRRRCRGPDAGPGPRDAHPRARRRARGARRLVAGAARRVPELGRHGVRDREPHDQAALARESLADAHDFLRRELASAHVAVACARPGAVRRERRGAPRGEPRAARGECGAARAGALGAHRRARSQRRGRDPLRDPPAPRGIRRVDRGAEGSALRLLLLARDARVCAVRRAAGCAHTRRGRDLPAARVAREADGGDAAARAPRARLLAAAPRALVGRPSPRLLAMARRAA